MALKTTNLTKLTKGTWVRCIDGEFTGEQRKLTLHVPRQGEYYSLRDWGISKNPVDGSSQITFLLNEITNRIRQEINPITHKTEYFEPSFRASRFELISDPQDISNTADEMINLLHHGSPS